MTGAASFVDLSGSDLLDRVETLHAAQLEAEVGPLRPRT